MFDQDGVDRLMRQGRIAFSRTGRPRLKTYFKDLPGVAVRDVSTDFTPINSATAERVGYPTQKPLALLEHSSIADDYRTSTAGPTCRSARTSVHCLRRRRTGTRSMASRRGTAPVAASISRSASHGRPYLAAVGLRGRSPGQPTVAVQSVQFDEGHDQPSYFSCEAA